MFYPSRPVPKHYFDHNCGRTELIRGVGTVSGKTQRTFFKGWAAFIRIAHSHGSKLHFEANVSKLPVTIYLNTDGDVRKLEPGRSASLKGVNIAAVVPANVSKDIVAAGKMDPSLFQQRMETVGASVLLEPLAAGKKWSTSESVPPTLKQTASGRFLLPQTTSPPVPLKTTPSGRLYAGGEARAVRQPSFDE